MITVLYSHTAGYHFSPPLTSIYTGISLISMGVQRRKANKLLVAESEADTAAAHRSLGTAPQEAKPRHPALQVLLTFVTACMFWTFMQILTRWQRQ